VFVLTFSATYAARHFVDAMLEGGGYKWLPANKKLGYTIPDTIVGDNNTEIRIPGGTLMEDLMEYEMSPAERDWELPEQYHQYPDTIKRPPSQDQEFSLDGERPVKVKVKKEPKPEKPKIDKSGLITVGEIATQMGIDAKEARGALRKMKVEKPDVGWAWSPDKVDAIKKEITKGLK
jgi:hypothetical protein